MYANFQPVDQVEAQQVEGGRFITGKFPGDDLLFSGAGIHNELKASHDLVRDVTIPG